MLCKRGGYQPTLFHFEYEDTVLSHFYVTLPSP
jgi:hypothetical protein